METAPPTAPRTDAPRTDAPRVAPPPETRRLAAWTAALFVVGLAGLWALSEAVAPVYGDYRGRHAWAMARLPTAEAAVFGSSHAQALRFEVLGVAGAPFHIGGSDLFESRAILQHVRPRAPRLRTVFLAVPYDAVDNAQVPSRTGRRRSVYLTTRRLRAISTDWRGPLTAPLAPVVRGDHWHGVLSRLASGAWAPVRPAPPEPLPERPLPVEALRIRADSTARAFIAGTRANLADDPTLCDRAAAAIEGFVADAEGLEVVLFTPPYPTAFAAPPRPCDLAGTARALADRRPDVAYVDGNRFMRTEEGLFNDGHHVGLKGARWFTRRLAEAVWDAPSAPVRAAGARGR